ncbi:hypothetical protein KZZ10_01500 [Alcaligenaceae bacterium LF4-65]|uniref:Regulatory protein, RpfE type n=1 Tax=Zwartia hollandica TaxID=324606 RepID=A0A953T1H8_9BURK|nr:hypothetical protein [Zwartia hollandica]MBZ1349310.1 hypothetical protein [Zwartia hollandica]
MEILIPGGLVPTSVAPDLAHELQRHCPALVDLCEHRTAEVVLLPPEQTGCTPDEALHLRRLGYAEGVYLGDKETLGTRLNLGAGLAPLAASIHSTKEPVWVAQLCSITIGREGARMIAPSSLRIEQHEADVLFEAASVLWAGSEISALALKADLWRVWPGEAAQAPSMSPNAVCQMSLSDWWPQDPSFKAWRRLLNEIQMLWHTHPVNEQRTQRGLPPINSLWLFGGARGWRPAATISPVHTLNALADACLEGDWARWIAQLPALSSELELALLQRTDTTIQPTLTLTGQRHAVRMNPFIPRWWQHLLPRRKQNWTDWWNLQN